MRIFRLFLLALIAFPFAGRAANPIPAAEDPALRQLMAKAILASGDEQTQLLKQLSEHDSKFVRATLIAWTRDGVYLYEPKEVPEGTLATPITLDDQEEADGKVRGIRIDNGEFVKDAAGTELRFDSDKLTAAEADLRLRSTIQQTLDLLALANPDPEGRQAAIQKLGKSQKPANLPILEAALAREKNVKLQNAIKAAIATIQLTDANPAVQTKAAEVLGELHPIGSLDDLQRVAAKPNLDPALATATKNAINSIQGYIQRVNFFGTIFRGLSLGSILLIVALGLAITFGLMGVINMAHGEMIAIGAYTCYVVQNIFGEGFSTFISLGNMGFSINIPGLHTGGWLYESYFLFAIPLSFVIAALAGILLERTVIRFLYSRPLESLLATWGVSLFMQQVFRLVFGANNVQVNSPSWLSGNFTFSDIIFGYNRLFVIAFAILIVIGTWLLLTKTPLGLLIRAVMQNRAMASCMGVRTERVNMMTFAFGSGLAGLAGAFLSQIGNVGPSLGQSYIVDAFMTVVVGGVGSIVGTIYSALGIGTADQVLQQIFGSPVLGKITVLCAIILFLQWKPGGLFPTRSRSLEG